jgi:hypothetical protein
MASEGGDSSAVGTAWLTTVRRRFSSATLGGDSAIDRSFIFGNPREYQTIIDWLNLISPRATAPISDYWRHISTQCILSPPCGFTRR